MELRGAHLGLRKHTVITTDPTSHYKRDLEIQQQEEQQPEEEQQQEHQQQQQAASPWFIKHIPAHDGWVIFVYLASDTVSPAGQEADVLLVQSLGGITPEENSGRAEGNCQQTNVTPRCVTT